MHTNSGIHNKAAYNILTSVDPAKKLIFTAQDVAAVFYITLTQQLSRTSQFSDSRRGVLAAARTLVPHPAAGAAEAETRCHRARGSTLSGLCRGEGRHRAACTA